MATTATTAAKNEFVIETGEAIHSKYRDGPLWYVGDEVFYTGAGKTWEDGDRVVYRLVYGGKGEVVGPATGEDGAPVCVQFPGNTLLVKCLLEVVGPATCETHKDKGVGVMFPGNTLLVECLLTSLSRTAPPTTLLGGYRVGDEVFYTLAGKTFASGNRLAYGGKGEVVGPATNEGLAEGLAVRFPGNTTVIDIYLYHLSRAAPPPLPGGYRVGDEVFYTGAWGKTCASGNRLVYGGKGEVVGPATGETHKDKGVGVMFPGNTGQVNCLLTSLTSLSRAAPPTTLPTTIEAEEERKRKGKAEQRLTSNQKRRERKRRERKRPPASQTMVPSQCPPASQTMVPFPRE